MIKLATRTRIVQEKYLKINGKVHHKIKVLALENGIEMRVLANAMLESILADEHKLTELVTTLEAQIDTDT